jgi:hypothetical protein
MAPQENIQDFIQVFVAKILEPFIHDGKIGGSPDWITISGTSIDSVLIFLCYCPFYFKLYVILDFLIYRICYTTRYTLYLDI